MGSKGWTALENVAYFHDMQVKQIRWLVIHPSVLHVVLWLVIYNIYIYIYIYIYRSLSLSLLLF